MAIAKDGILGSVTGKVSTLIFYESGNKNLIRSKGVRDVPPTAGELKNTGKMRTLMDLFRSIKPYLKAGFNIEAKAAGLNYHNVATSVNRLNLAGLADGLQHLDFDTLQLSKGNGLMPETPNVTAEAGGLRFSWSWDADDYEAAEDQVMMMAYLPDQNTAVFETAGAKRSHSEDFLPMQPSYLLERLEVFISFISKDRSRVSNSLYLGRIN